MSEQRHRRSRALTEKQRQERFNAGGRSFTEALRAVLAGGRDDGREDRKADDRQAEEPGAGK